MRFKPFLLLCGLILSLTAYGKAEMGPLYVHLSDAMAEVKKGDVLPAVPHLTALQQAFDAQPNRDSTAGRQVTAALHTALASPDLLAFEQLSKALYAFEKEQNPVDYAKKRQQFAKRVMPVYRHLSDAVQSQQLDSVQAAYKQFNTAWTLNEKIVRETSLGHYGKIETAMTLLRIAMLAEPPNFAEMAAQSQHLHQALADFNAGNLLQPQAAAAPNAPQTLADGIALLERSHLALQENRTDQAAADIMLFIQQWPIFEGEVRTRNGGLYSQVESELPVIVAKAADSGTASQLEHLINELKALKTGGYTALDALLVLLREGLEALLIVMALVTTLNAANQPQGKRWVYGGAALGVIASLLGAVALQRFFPLVSAGTNREILEGSVGIVAVVMMLFVGAWLHNKATLDGWKRFVQRHIAKAMATGSLLSMLALSFLSVFREGAETLLFYAGMLPMMNLSDFLLGIGGALALLAILAAVMVKSSQKLPIHHLFKVMTLLIYVLGFKILGVSIHALQLTQILPQTLADVPNLPFIGFYASWQGIAAQAAYLVLIPITARLFNGKN